MFERLFARIGELLEFGPGGVETEKDHPLGLTEGEIKTLRGFVGSAEQEVVNKIIDRTIRMQSETLLNCEGEHLERNRSIIVGLRLAGTMPDTIIRTLDKEDDLHEQRTRELAEERARNLDAATFGTPARRSFGNGRNRE